MRVDSSWHSVWRWTCGHAVMFVELLLVTHHVMLDSQHRVCHVRVSRAEVCRAFFICAGKYLVLGTATRFDHVFVLPCARHPIYPLHVPRRTFHSTIPRESQDSATSTLARAHADPVLAWHDSSSAGTSRSQRLVCRSDTPISACPGHGMRLLDIWMKSDCAWLVRIGLGVRCECCDERGRVQDGFCGTVFTTRMVSTQERIYPR